ncbi:MAG: zincin-like metallopeptidase domain-containing protein [Chthoniobacterales bacterium]
MSRDIYESITARFIDQLQKGTVPWQRPWTGVQNLVSRKPYRGINSLILGGSEFQSPYWISFKQAKDLGGTVRQGEKATPVIYYKLFEKRDDKGNLVLGSNGHPTRIPFIRWSNVFNLDQTEGIQAPTQTATQEVIQPLEKAAAIVRDAKLCPIRETGFVAAYSPKDDVIRMPAKKTFRSPEAYYQTLFHEMTHATGHASRLDREGITQPVKFGSERYSKEELIAELGASFLANEAGILNKVEFENSAAYLASWVERLKKDPKMIFTASSQAQRSTDLILGIELKESLSGETQSPALPREEPILAQEIPRVKTRSPRMSL